MVHLPSCQLHISVNRTAQIYLELHFCVELHTKKALCRSLKPDPSRPGQEARQSGAFEVTAEIDASVPPRCVCECHFLLLRLIDSTIFFK